MLGLGLTYVYATCCFFLFLYFLRKLLRVRSFIRELLPFLGLTSAFLCYSIAYIVTIWFDFLRWQYNETLMPLYKLFIALMGGNAIGTTLFLESIWKKTKYIVTMSWIIMTIVILFLNTLQDISTAEMIFVAPFVLIGFIILYFVFVKPTSGFLRRRMYLAISGWVLMIVGLVGRVDSLATLIGLYVFSVGTILMIVGTCGMGYGFAAFSTFTDFNWRRKLRELFVIANGGTCLYAFSFDQNSQIEDSGLVAGGLSGIQSLLSEIVNTSENLRLIEYQNVKILVEQRSLAMFILIIKEESSVLEEKLHLFAEEFDIYFHETLQNWSGQINLFQPTQILIQRYFESR